MGSRASRVTTAARWEETAERVRAIRAAAAEVKPDINALCHGGPIAGPAGGPGILGLRAGIAGGLEASSTDRRPSEVGITESMRRFMETRRAAATAH